MLDTTHITGPALARAASSSPITTAQAPSDDGQVSSYLTGSEIEAELSGHPAVDDAAVFGIPHEDWGEEIKAVVQPGEGAAPAPS